MASSVALAEAHEQASSSGALHEKEIQELKNKQFLRLQQEARSIFRTVSGLPGIARKEQWDAMVEKAGIDYDTGRFLIERLGAKRYLDPELMAVLIRLRQGLLADIGNPSTSDMMLADSAIIAYRQMLRVQGWIDSICLVVERGLFGQDPLDLSYGEVRCEQLEQRIAQLQNELVPLLERCQRMLCRALDRLDQRRGGSPKVAVAVGIAGQVNIGDGMKG